MTSNENKLVYSILKCYLLKQLTFKFGKGCDTNHLHSIREKNVFLQGNLFLTRNKRANQYLFEISFGQVARTKFSELETRNLLKLVVVSTIQLVIQSLFDLSG